LDEKLKQALEKINENNAKILAIIAEQLKQDEDMQRLLESKTNQFFAVLNEKGFVVCGDRHVSMNLRTKLDIARIDYFVVNCLSAEYFMTTYEGAKELYDTINTHYTSVPIDVAKEQVKTVINTLERWV
jgi:hypothetical protein